MNKPLSTHDSIPLRDCGLLNDECRSKGFCQGHSEPLSTQSPSDEELRLDNVSTYAGLATAIHNFAGRLAKQSLDMDEQVKNYNMLASQKNEIVTSTIESFVYAILKTRENVVLSRKAQWDRENDALFCRLDRLEQLPVNSSVELIIAKNDPKNGESDYWWLSYGDITLTGYASLKNLLIDFDAELTSLNKGEQ